MDINKHIKFFIIVAYFALGYFFITTLFPKLINLFLPFVLAFFVAALANPVAEFLKTKYHFKKVIATAVSLLLILTIVSGFVTLIINRLIVELSNLIKNIPQISAFITDTYFNFAERWEIIRASIPSQFSIYAHEMLKNLASSLTDIVTGLTKITIDSATSIAAKIPSALLLVVAFILASIFITNDYKNIKRNILMQFPESTRNVLLKIKKYLNIAFKKYLKGMLIIMTITFFELLLGLTILGVDYALTFALIIAIIDILPIFGTGAFLIPWGIGALLFQNYYLGFGLLILYAIITVVRQFIEPKIISQSLGTYPLITLVAIYVGFKLFGFAGMIFMPILVLVMVTLNNVGIIKIWSSEK